MAKAGKKLRLPCRCRIVVATPRMYLLMVVSKSELRTSDALLTRYVARGELTITALLLLFGWVALNVENSSGGDESTRK